VSDKQERVLPHKALLAATGARARAGQLPPVLLQQVPGRLQVICISLLITVMISWLGVNMASGRIRRELQSFYQWVGPVTIIVSATAMLSVARSPRVSPETLVRLALLFEVV